MIVIAIAMNVVVIGDTDRSEFVVDPRLDVSSNAYVCLIGMHHSDYPTKSGEIWNCTETDIEEKKRYRGGLVSYYPIG